MARGLFVTGTDTGVGKSLIACSLVRMLRQQSVDAVGFKPVATGAIGGKWEDAEALCDASDRCEPVEKICPLRFAAPLAPTLAAEREGVQPDLAAARSALEQLRAAHQAVIIEGVGGILVPLDIQTLVLDFAREAGFPLLVVCRSGLGTINHTLLTIREIERAKLPLAGLIVNTTEASDAPLADGARREIERLSGQRVLAFVPHLEKPLVEHAVAALVSQVGAQAMLGQSRGTARM